ncbi:MAG: threonine dehydrogenase-like Zn-dependent dehydrogenase [Planctomycetota bacterium]
MRGLWIEDGALRLREDLDDLQAKTNETRVKILRAGVCATDLALLRGYMDFRGVPGHEFVGVALEGPHKDRRVVGDINAACGECDWCAKGLGRHCPNRTVLGIFGRPGAFADEICLPTRNLHLVPESLPTDWATFAEPAAAAYEMTEQLSLQPGMRALVQGDGRLGLLCAQVLAGERLEVDLIGRHPERGEWLPDSIRHLGNGKKEAHGKLYDLVVEATGHENGIATALGRVRPRGTVLLKTTTERSSGDGLGLDLAKLVVDEISLVGSRCGPFAPALEALSDGRLVVAPMIEARYPLSEGALAFDRASQRGVLKILIDVNDDDAN